MEESKTTNVEALPHRRRLPSRRPGETHALSVGNHTFTATFGFDQDGQPREVFLDGAKDGTEMATILDDVAVLVSVALQHGIRATALAKSVARLPLVPLTPADLAEAAGPRQTAPAPGKQRRRRSSASCSTFCLR